MRLTAAAGSTANNDCTFCNPPQPFEVITHTTRGRAIASFGAFIPGWTLVVPPRHVPSIAALTPAEWPEYEFLFDTTRALVEDRFGETIAFEHGASSFFRAAGCGINHAHAHIVPIDIDVREAVSLLGGEFEAYEWEPTGRRPTSLPDHDYIWVADRTGTWIRHTRDQPSQVVRRALASAVGAMTWDWKENHRLDMVRRTQSVLTMPVQRSA